MFPGARGSSIPKKDILVNFLPGFPGVPFENEGTGFPKWPQPYGVFTPPARDTGVYTNLDYSPQSFAGDFRGTKYWIEESRIRGGYNNASTNLGIKAHLYDEESSYNRRDNALIYSGVYNKRTEFNRTNVFNGADNITRALDPTHGSVQYLHAMDNDLTILQEAKVNKALIDKDAIYSAEGLPLTTQSNVVIGQVTPYVGDFGISRNPESFAAFGFRRYFTDKDRNSIMRLSRDGLTEISKYGMADFFRDTFEEINDAEVIRFSKEYVVSSQGVPWPPDPLVLVATGSTGNFIELAIPGVEPFGEDIEIGALIDVMPVGNVNFPPVWYSTGFVVTGLEEEGGAPDSVQYVYIRDLGGIGGQNGILGVSGITPEIDGRPYKVRFRTIKKDAIIGTWDNYKQDYIVSIQKSGSKTEEETSDYYSTVAFSEDIKGWTTFYSYRPTDWVSSKGVFYTCKDSTIYESYKGNEYNNFFGVQNGSHIDVIFNANPSMVKVFKTISYEGTNGWECSFIESDVTGVMLGGLSLTDRAATIKSYNEGLVNNKGLKIRTGFNLKENRYVSEIKNQSLPAPGQVLKGKYMTGIKGYYALARIKTDTTTEVTGSKELFSVGTEIVKSS